MEEQSTIILESKEKKNVTKKPKKSKKNNETTVKKEKPAKKIFSVERAINVSRGIMYQTSFKDRASFKEDLGIGNRKGIGTQNNFDAKVTPEEIEKKVSQAQIFEADYCYLHNNNDTLILKYNVKFLPLTQRVSRINGIENKNEIVDLIHEYIGSHSMRELSIRYVNNIVNARGLWRNRGCAVEIETRIFADNDKIYTFDSKAFSIREFTYDNDDICELAQMAEAALTGNREMFSIDVIHYARLGFGHEVYPSQEFIDGGSAKTLFKIGNNAGIHSEKLGNAIRTIDTWYPDFDKYGMPIAISPYGAAKLVEAAFRRERKYALSGIFDVKVNEKKEISENEFSFLIANFIRGGFFEE